MNLKMYSRLKCKACRECPQCRVEAKNKKAHLTRVQKGARTEEKMYNTPQQKADTEEPAQSEASVGDRCD